MTAPVTYEVNCGCVNLSRACRDGFLSGVKNLQLGQSVSCVKVFSEFTLRMRQGVQEDKAHDNGLEKPDRVTTGCSPSLEPRYTSDKPLLVCR